MATTSTKQNPKASVAPISGIRALMAAAGHQFEDFEYGGVKVPMRAVTISQMIRLCRRFPVLRALFDEQGGDIIEAVMTAGDEAVAAVIAYACDAEGDDDFEAWILTAPDDVVEGLVKKALRLTFKGENPEVFFLKVFQRIRLEAFAAETPEMAEAA